MKLTVTLKGEYEIRSDDGASVYNFDAPEVKAYLQAEVKSFEGWMAEQEPVVSLKPLDAQAQQAVALLKSLKAQGKLTPAELAICAVLRRVVGEMRE